MKDMTNLALLLAASIQSVSAAITSPQVINVKAWPFSSPTGISFATISYDATTSNASIQDASSFSPPASDSSGLIRLGFHKGPETDETWTGVAIPSSSLDQDKIKTIRIHVDEQGQIQALSLASRYPITLSKKAAKAKSAADKAAGKSKKKQNNKNAKESSSSLDSEGQVQPHQQDATGLVRVEVIRPIPGPVPVLNKPVVVNKDGRVEDAVPEKSFLQKYWWAIGLFLLVQIVMGSGGDEKR